MFCYNKFGDNSCCLDTVVECCEGTYLSQAMCVNCITEDSDPACVIGKLYNYWFPIIYIYRAIQNSAH